MQQSLDQMAAGGRKRPRAWPFHGQIRCQATLKKKDVTLSCQNNAYYEQGGLFCCGVHSSSKKRRRTRLQVDPKKAEKRRQELRRWQQDVEEASGVNTQLGRRGRVRVGKLRMMRAPPHLAGLLKVFPNYRHAKRVDGFGCHTLSPKSLGPVAHGMPGWPVAKNLENFHQAGKIFSCEVVERPSSSREAEDSDDGDELFSGYEIKPEAIALRKKMYRDSVPYRHKFKYPAMRRLTGGAGGNINKPLFSVYYHRGTGKERRYTYLQSRYFYCHHYEVLSRENQQLGQLRDKIQQGVGLFLLGYDGRDVKRLTPEEKIWDCLYRYYLDDSKPFGHELVLYTLLVTPIHDRCLYPWNRFRREHPGLYDGFID